MRIIEANGARIPALGYGTWTLRDDDATAMVEAAIAAGFRHVDTAQMYDNEVAVGRGIANAALPRAEIFLTTKIWPDQHAPQAFLDAAAVSVDRLGTVPDLLLLHWPSKAVPPARTVEAAGVAMQRGLATHVGVSNFTTKLLADVLATGVRLVCNQVEYHPFLDQSKVLAATRAAGMALTAYCPLARGRVRAAPAITEVAMKHGVSPEQVALAWLVGQDGVAAIPRTANPQRLIENLASGTVTLSAEERAAIDALGAESYRICDFDFAPVWDAA